MGGPAGHARAARPRAGQPPPRPEVARSWSSPTAPWTRAPGETRGAASALPFRVPRASVSQPASAGRPAPPPRRRTPGGQGTDHISPGPSATQPIRSRLSSTRRRSVPAGWTSLTRSRGATGRPPGAAAALTASPHATQKPPPGPGARWAACAATATSAPSTCRARGQQGRVRRDRLEVAAEGLAHGRCPPLAARLGAVQRRCRRTRRQRPPSSITCATASRAPARPPPAAPPARQQRGVQVSDHPASRQGRPRRAQRLVSPSSPCRRRPGAVTCGGCGAALTGRRVERVGRSRSGRPPPPGA